MTRAHHTLRLAVVGLAGVSLMAASCCAPRAGLQPVRIQSNQLAPTPDSSLPPARFQGRFEPVISLTIYVPAAAVDQVCQELGLKPTPGYEIKGCTIRRPGDRFPAVILPNPCEAPGPYMSPSYVACHEAGHVQGWPASHGE